MMMEKQFRQNILTLNTEHSVSGVTLSTVQLAGQSFAQIQIQIKLASHENSDLTNFVNPSSTTTKGVEYFH